MQRHLFLPCLALASAGAVPALAQSTINVPADQPTIQAGIDASVSGDTVLVAPGTYLEQDIDFGGRGITVRGSGGPSMTIVDAQSLGRGFLLTSGETGAVLEGFTIQNGLTPDGGDGTPSSPNGADAGRGGGVLIVDATATVRNCWLVDNVGGTGGDGQDGLGDLLFPAQGTGNGGEGGSGVGLSIEGASASVLVEACVFRDNLSGAGGDGGRGLDGYDDTFCSFPFSGLENGAPGGTGGRSGRGAGLYRTQATVVVRDCVFDGNLNGLAGQGGQGGAAGFDCFFGPGFGGTGGTGGAGGAGAGIWSVNAGTLSVENCTFVDNTAGTGGAGGPAGPAGVGFPGGPGSGGADGVGGGARRAGGTFLVTSSAFWGNLPNHVSGPMTVTYSCVPGGTAGTGNIDADPLIADAANGDYTLLAGSPCIDAGDGTGLAVDGLFPAVTSISAAAGGPVDFEIAWGVSETDAAGNVRLVDDPATPDTGVGFPVVDMGAHEFGAAAYAEPDPVTLPLYWLLGSVSGTTPGLPFGGQVLPLNPDAYFDLGTAAPNTGINADTLGLLDPDGTADAQIAVPASPSLAGVTVHHAALVFGVTEVLTTGQIAWVSDPVQLDILP